MLKLSVSNIKAVASLAKTTIVKHSPEILMGIGAVTFVGTIVAAAKETVEEQEILVEHQVNMDDLTYEYEEENTMDDKAYKKARFEVYKSTSLRTAKNYAPAVVLGATSLTCFFGAYGIMKRRYATLVVAYTALEESFRKYRERVIADRGEDADIYYLTGSKPKEITKKDEEGNKVKEKQLLLPDGSPASPYAFKFSKYREDGTRNKQWVNDVMLNRSYIIGQVQWLEHQLSERCVLDDDYNVVYRGSVFLNELRNLLGESATETGSVAGWLYSNGEKNCNGYIDLHMIEACEEDPETGEVIPCVFFRPNCDGLIYDLVGKKEKVPFPWHSTDDAWGEDITI